MDNPFKKFFLRQDRQDDQAGICWDDSGVGIARLSDMRGEKPKLESCFWQGWPEEADLDRHQHLRKLMEEHGLLKVPFNCCLQIEDYDLFPNDAADVTPSEMAAAMKWVVRDRLDFGLDEAVVDCFPIPDPLRMSTDRKVYVIATRKAVVQRYLDAGRRARMNIRAIEVVELALNNVAALLPEINKGVALLYYPPTGEAGSLIVAKEDKLYLARRINAINRDAQDLGLDPTENIAAEVQRSLDYVEADFIQSPISALYVAVMPELEGILRDGVAMRMNIRTKMLRLGALFDSGTNLDQESVHRCLPALGEALRPLDEGE